ncbi:hypothetical protein C3F36_17850 [Aeromonas sp. ASNIH2]|nr:hypothetical protein C3F36_17850 [Aeromonas sp. ASNIH2]
MAPDSEHLRDAGGWLMRLAGPGGGFAWMFILAIWGGTVSYLSRLKQNRELAFSFAEWIGEMAISGFAGLLMAYVAMELQASWYVAAVSAGIGGHMGGRALFLMELALRRRLGMGEPK